MTRYFLGVDVGSTKTHALICAEDGTCVGAGHGGSANHEGTGKEKAQEVIQGAVNQAIEMAGIQASDVVAAGFGIAGYDWDEDRPMMDDIIGSLGLGIPYGLVNDGGLGLFAGSTKGWGISIAAGTGNNIRGRDKNGNQGRVTGEGLLFAEWGGGGDLVFRAIQSISREWSKRGDKTTLTDIFINEFGAKNIDDLLAGIARGRYRIRATQAPLVFSAAKNGDQVAQDAVRWLGLGLGDMACGVIRQLSLENEEVEIVCCGSMFNVSPLVLETVQEVINEVAPKAIFIHFSAPPVTGAVVLAMEQVGLNYLPIREKIIETGEALLLR